MGVSLKPLVTNSGTPHMCHGGPITRGEYHRPRNTNVGSRP